MCRILTALQLRSSDKAFPKLEMLYIAAYENMHARQPLASKGDTSTQSINEWDLIHAKHLQCLLPHTFLWTLAVQEHRFSQRAFCLVAMY
ncbi:hypothetical protein NDU88_006108 [Pleurodeles waltl]|uniref:Uncharacterized protein n=1 Tax=Pleurodeles waltl TaxID=8319 RepID=A0AAV7SNL6_PLEWA|nr:hypothetical protein NDU88_006108 [Pleurodeles waltl]